MRVIDAAGIDAALSPQTLIAALDEAFRGQTNSPKRHHHVIARPKADATLLLMPAWSGGDDPTPYLGVKIVSVFPDNSTRSLPSVLGTYLLMDGRSGLPLAALDGARLTLWRTAAASALASSKLSVSHASTLTMVGAGALAPFLIRAHMAVRPISHVLLWNHRPEKAVALAAKLSGEGLAVEAIGDLKDAVARSQIVSCATLSKEPLVKGEWLRPGTHVDLVGAYNLSMREVDDTALRRASLFIDTPAALSEGGDIAIALKTGAIDTASVQADLHALCRGEHPGRRSDDEITLFKSVGAALEDLAAAMLVWRSAA